MITAKIINRDNGNGRYTSFINGTSTPGDPIVIIYTESFGGSSYSQVFARTTADQSGAFSVSLGSLYSDTNYSFEIDSGSSSSKAYLSGTVNGLAPLIMTSASWSANSVTVTFSHSVAGSDYAPTLYKVSNYSYPYPGQDVPYRYLVDDPIEIIPASQISISGNQITYTFSSPLQLGAKYGLSTDDAARDYYNQRISVVTNYIYDLSLIHI